MSNTGKQRIWIGLAFIMLLGLLAPRLASASRLLPISGNRMVLVLPARQQTLQLGFDMLSIRPRLLLISYQGTADDDDAGMHLWNGREWLRLVDADYERGAFLAPDAVVYHTYLIGAEDEVPWILQYRPFWSEEMHWIQSLLVSDLVNVFGERFRFTREEWQWIAGLHGLSLYESRISRPEATRQEVWAERTAGEARRPLLERLRRDRPTETDVAAESPGVGREPWVEVPVHPVPVEKFIDKPADPVDPPVDEPSAEPDVPEPDTDPEPDVPEPDIDPEPVAPEPDTALDFPEPVKGGRPPEAETVPLVTGLDDGLPESTDALAEDVVAPELVESAVPVDGDEMTLTPEEIEFFELIRGEFPEFHDLPDLP